MRGMSPIVLVLAVLVMSGCQVGDNEVVIGPEDQPEPLGPVLPERQVADNEVVDGPRESEALVRSEVIKAATSCLSKLKWGDRYITDSPRIVETSEQWYVYFKHVNAATRRPSEGLVVVQKASGVASWRPGR